VPLDLCRKLDNLIRIDKRERLGNIVLATEPNECTERRCLSVTRERQPYPGAGAP